ncbi:peptidase domain-containing ABC transporter [Pedobacter soli]|uniref:ATP-binding cassette, subfamily B n=1 Tax=Pedobacter soli TaxID=390242 RepID=A0A1G6I479_9SPHI|nr:peptidase domain-containing ABC transporter [Pedobacter soli]SDC01352.1 ATP-binding cassette, subfamily B [Pedobacter soli]
MLKFVAQHDQMDCGPACLAMIAGHYGQVYPLQYLRDNSFLTREGVSLLSINEAAKKIGFQTFTALLNLEELHKQRDFFPCVLHWNQNHFLVLDRISKNIISGKYQYHIADPAHGWIKLSAAEFQQSWISNNDKGVVLFLKPTADFDNNIPPKIEQIKLNRIFKLLLPYKRQIALLFSLLLLGSIVSLIFPFLTEKLIDKGVNGKNLNLISLVLLAQLCLYVGSITIEIIRNWLMLYVGTKISITIISDFLKKILRLPIKFFDTKMLGDFNQRIQDNERIEDFLTSQSLITFFSMITFLVFFGVLWYYNLGIVAIYAILTGAALLWSFYWLRKRKIIDYYRFQQKGENQESIYEIINGVTEMKLNQFEDFKRMEWENIQQKLFKTNIRILKVNQFQVSGFDFINQIKNILVTFLAATLVVKGSMSLGELLAISYIIGQLNSPVNQLVGFFRSLQDARLSLERLNEVQNHKEEEQNHHKMLSFFSGLETADKPQGIHIKNLSFQYEGPKSPYVLKDISFLIPKGQVTAIVGASGSGKTTFMKLLLKFYAPSDGDIYYNEDNLNELSAKNLRENCGVVMQDGFIFSDTIERNIVTKDTDIDKQRLNNALIIANIKSFVAELPLGLSTKIGASGNGISGGQKQRILIARAVYKNPHYIFFDEATSALDAENEKIIHDNLQTFYKGKTAIVIAHRLSTVKNANQIIVLKHGKVVEIGTHHQLVQNRSDYFNLVKNQLELGN